MKKMNLLVFGILMSLASCMQPTDLSCTVGVDAGCGVSTPTPNPVSDVCQTAPQSDACLCSMNAFLTQCHPNPPAEKQILMTSYAYIYEKTIPSDSRLNEAKGTACNLKKEVLGKSGLNNQYVSWLPGVEFSDDLASQLSHLRPLILEWHRPAILDSIEFIKNDKAAHVDKEGNLGGYSKVLEAKLLLYPWDESLALKEQTISFSSSLISKTVPLDVDFAIRKIEVVLTQTQGRYAGFDQVRALGHFETTTYASFIPRGDINLALFSKILDHTDSKQFAAPKNHDTVPYASYTADITRDLGAHQVVHAIDGQTKSQWRRSSVRENPGKPTFLTLELERSECIGSVYVYDLLDGIDEEKIAGRDRFRVATLTLDGDSQNALSSNKALEELYVSFNAVNKTAKTIRIDLENFGGLDGDQGHYPGINEIVIRPCSN